MDWANKAKLTPFGTIFILFYIIIHHPNTPGQDNSRAGSLIQSNGIAAAYHQTMYSTKASPIAASQNWTLVIQY